MPTPPKVNTLVTLYVNTAFPGLSQSNIEQHVWMADSNGDIANNNAGQIANYVTGIQRNGNVTWVPAVINIRDNPSDYVVITDVQFTNAGNKMNITPEPTNKSIGNTTHINGKANGNPGDLLSYTIFFTVNHLKSDGTWETMDLHVDPKLNMN